VREAAREAERRGAELTIVQVEEDGTLNPQKISEALKENTVLVSMMYVNNETGAIQPVSRIARLIKEYRKEHHSKIPYFHTDASQAANVLPVDLDRLGADMMTLEAAKVGGEKGVGLLAIRPNVEIRPIIFGGRQERGLRAGTENVAGVEVFACALTRAEKSASAEHERLTTIKNIFVQELSRLVPPAVINSPTESVPSIVSISIPGALHEFLAIKLALCGLAVSTGSSCRNIGEAENENEAIRFSFGKSTTEKEARGAVRLLAQVVI
jgi:cysteine desulfurase